MRLPQADTKTLAMIRSFFRCLLAGAAFNTRGMQNISLTFAMQPGLSAIHRDPKDYRMALRRYVRHYQSHPFWMPCLVGIFLHMEESISQDRFPPKMLSKVKDTTTYTLSAIGDSVFAGSLLILWALSSICLYLSGHGGLSLGFGLAFFLGLQAFRVYTFVAGLRHGFRFLERLRRWDLINWGTRIKYVNALLLVWLWALVWPHPLLWWQWLLGVVALMLFGRFVRTGLVSRVFAAAAFLGLIHLYPLLRKTILDFLGGMG
ncbi:PTS system mannose/fructose/sorbose family transporter subunit IID [Salidesulfovibrio onnuriiensis]|uniref:PTS system mannose/fructose/sorbose family transporter subunit IID n=1 Tax=Salidesulfovibrio onnuriiensis TaxID=2583823 RepID=UPI0011CC09CB|nr:PTS system mannose/fructose/sorbose family transporter subunit IID [Salidesulfovibrio onnuriiensis]